MCDRLVGGWGLPHGSPPGRTVSGWWCPDGSGHHRFFSRRGDRHRSQQERGFRSVEAFAWLEHSENFGESGRLKYRHEREKNEASVDPFLTGKNGKGRSNGGGERTGRNSERRGWLCHAGFPHIHGSGPTSRYINIARAAAARRFPQRCWLWETGEARGPVDMWETCRRARISVVGRWGVEQQPERKRCEHVRFGGIRRARLGGRRSRSAQFRIAHWMGGPRGAAAAQRRGRRPARRLCEKSAGRALGALAWSGRRPRRWRPPCWNCAMRALRSG